MFALLAQKIRFRPKYKKLFFFNTKSGFLPLRCNNFNGFNGYFLGKNVNLLKKTGPFQINSPILYRWVLTNLWRFLKQVQNSKMSFKKLEIYSFLEKLFKEKMIPKSGIRFREMDNLLEKLINRKNKIF